MCNEYNGYSNYQTWNASLWLDNDQGTYEYFQEVIKETQPTTYELADQLRDFLTDDHPLQDNGGMFADLMRHAIDNINWDEIAENMVSE